MKKMKTATLILIYVAILACLCYALNAEANPGTDPSSPGPITCDGQIIYNLELHETYFDICLNRSILRVPGGWIYGRKIQIRGRNCPACLSPTMKT